MDITWEANYPGQVITCEFHGERNTVIACPVCIGYGRMIINRYETLVETVRKNADDNDYCVVCDNHPSHGHSDDCPIGEGGSK